MKLYTDENHDYLYNHLESLKEVCHDNISNILDFCQECICDTRLKYLPDTVDIRSESVVFNYEETQNHLMISFKKFGMGFDDSSIDLFSFKNEESETKTKNNLSWNEVIHLINEWY